MLGIVWSVIEVVAVVGGERRRGGRRRILFERVGGIRGVRKSGTSVGGRCHHSGCQGCG